MQIRVGYQLTYTSSQPTPMILALNVHPSRAADLIVTDKVCTDIPTSAASYIDAFGNVCTRLVAPTGTDSLGACGARPPRQRMMITANVTAPARSAIDGVR